MRKAFLPFVPALFLAALAGCPSGGDGGDAGPSGDCVAACDGRVCGDDGCGGTCGTCGVGRECSEDGAACVPEGCVRKCTGRQCGDDGCGGSCGTCPAGQTCNPFKGVCSGACDGDCTGRLCGDDGCGGSCGTCEGDTDCLEGACKPRPKCTDGARNGDETDADCGGPACPACAVGRTCALPRDCATGLCPDGTCAPDLSCKDGQKGPDETDVDCGGPKCTPCALTRFCVQHGDCLSQACIYGVCKEPTCTDGARNQGESDIDCGGPCGRCPDGRTCQAAADCVSGKCAGTCVSCGDGKPNGDESDVDCGGTCGPCVLGRKCARPSDCQSGACESQACCTPNACGQCTTSPKEICNGLDDDCNGQTDETPGIGAGDACPLQQGACAGARARCAGKTGWQCDPAAYQAHSAKYETTEASCDGVDNDCDGETDEGLKNTCGQCGPVPAEVCNGVDDDCNALTDEDDRCAACFSNPEPQPVDQVDSGWGFTMSWTNYLAGLGDDAWALVYNRGGSAGLQLVRLRNGYDVAKFPAGVAQYDVASLAAGDGSLHVAVESRPDDCYQKFPGSTDCMVYARYDAQGTRLETTTLAGSVFSGDGHSGVAAVKGHTAVSGTAEGSGGYLLTRSGSGAWGWSASTHANDYGSHLAMRSNGDVFLAWRADAYDPSPAYVSRLDEASPKDWDIDPAAGRIVLRAGPDDTLHVVYDNAGIIWYRALKKGSGTWTAPSQVGYGTSPTVAVDPAGKPVVLYVVSEDGLELARKTSSGWTPETVLAQRPDLGTIAQTAAVIDPAGRVHVTWVAMVPSTYGTNLVIRYLMHCGKAPACTPSCSGKACGDDGCGGSCGQCPDGQTCQAGACQGGGGSCGLDPANTCSGRCGKYTAGASCQCNASCTGYGDCCPDKADCCGG